MVISKIGINFSKIKDAVDPEFGFMNLTKEEFVESIPAQANSLTGDYFGIIVLITITIFLFWILTEKTNYGYFKYSHIRGLGLSLGISSLIGTIMLMLGFITNYTHLGYLVALYSLMIIYTILKNPDN